MRPMLLLMLLGGGSPVQAWYVYGGVFGAVLIQSMGIPFPAVVVLVAAALYATTVSTISLLVIVSATILGGLIGGGVAFALGLRMGERVIEFLWRHAHLSEGKVKLGLYLIARYGAQMLVLGRFVSVIRPFQGYLAGSVRMMWQAFFLFSGIGLALWATIYAVGAYLFGSNLTGIRESVVGKVVVALVVVALACGMVLLYRNIGHLQAGARRAMPGPLGPPFSNQSSAEINPGGPA